MRHYRDLSAEQLTTLYETLAQRRENLLHEVAALAVEQAEVINELNSKEHHEGSLRPLQLAG